jgi:hypothetical protein
MEESEGTGRGGGGQEEDGKGRPVAGDSSGEKERRIGGRSPGGGRGSLCSDQRDIPARFH